MRLQIGGKLGDADGRAGLVKNLADFRHAVGDGDDRAQRRGFLRPAQEFDEGDAKPGEGGVDIMVIGVQVEGVLGVDLALLVHDRLE